jgi:parallel beta-helix repeat protein
VTLAGEGKDSILFLDPKQAGPAIINASDDMHDVTLRDFVVEGATVTKPSTDPNQDRRVRSYQNAPSRAGIILSGQTAGQMRNIRLEHLTVRHCTHQGVAIRGAAQVVIATSDFSDNGGSVVPGPGLEHNLLLTHVIGANVTGNRLDDSPWGDGLNVAESSDITIDGNEAARNRGSGLRLSDSRNVHIRGNVAEANDHDGVLLDALFDGDRNLEVAENLASNNGLHGIEIVRAVEGVVHANTAVGNGPGGQLAIISSERIVR